MKIDFTNRRVLVTASTGGIGFAAAQGFLAAGANVIINGRSNAGVEAAMARLAGAHPKVGASPVISARRQPARAWPSSTPTSTSS